MSLFSLSTWSIFFGWMRQGGHSEQLLFFALFYQSTPSCLKVVGGGVGWGGVGGPCDFSVSPSPFGLDFGTLGLRTWAWQLIPSALLLVTLKAARFIHAFYCCWHSPHDHSKTLIVHSFIIKSSRVVRWVDDWLYCHLLGIGINSNSQFPPKNMNKIHKESMNGKTSWPIHSVNWLMLQ